VQNELHERSPFSLNLTQNDASRSYGIHIYSCWCSCNSVEMG
jgi:hypothetical protein